MEFDPLWLVLAAPLLFAAGWVAARWDFRQLRQERTESPRAYFEGLNLLLNERHDEAIDAFVEAVQNDPDTAELHFALGNLFRRRGEFERAVRVHQHLLERADLSADQRLRAQLALAQDFLAAGLFDRAEAAYKLLLGSRFEQEASLALLNIHERTRDWPQALTAAERLQSLGAGSFTQRMAHYQCQMAEALSPEQATQSQALLAKAHQTSPQSARPLVARVEQALAAGDSPAALAAAESLANASPSHLGLVAAPLVAHMSDADLPGLGSRLAQLLERAQTASPSGDVTLAVLQLAARLHRDLTEPLTQALNERTDLRFARRVVEATETLPHRPQLLAAIDAALRPLDRYRCAACGFEATRYFWQCPGCHSWDSFPPRRLVEDLR